MPESLSESRRIKIKPIRAQAAQAEGGVMSSTPRSQSQSQSQSQSHLQSQAQSRSQPQTQPQPQTQSQSQTQSQLQNQSQSENESQPQCSGTKRKRRDEHDAELLPLLQGPSVEVVIGTGSETTSWTLPIALLVKHSDYFCRFLDVPAKEETVSTNPKVILADRIPAIFRVFVQWIYFDTIPDRFGLIILSKYKASFNVFLLWTMGDYLMANTFKNRIMCELYASYLLSGYDNVLGSILFNATEIDYCWSRTPFDSKLRKFIVDTLALHIVFGDYIRITRENDWYKLITKYADLQVQIITTIAASSNSFSDEVTEVPQLRTYLRGAEAENGTKTEGITRT